MPNSHLVLTLATALLATFACDAMAAEWRVDPAASRLTFIGTQAGSPFEGSFETFSATIRFDESDLPASKAVVSIDMASVKTGNAQRDDAVKGQDWFGVATYPKAQFETKAFRHVGGNRYEADAVLTIRNGSKPVVYFRADESRRRDPRRRRSRHQSHRLRRWPGSVGHREIGGA